MFVAYNYHHDCSCLWQTICSSVGGNFKAEMTYNKALSSVNIAILISGMKNTIFINKSSKNIKDIGFEAKVYLHRLLLLQASSVRLFQRE